MPKPLLISVFANDYEGQQLPMLDQECKHIDAILENRESPIDHKSVSNASVKDIFEVLDRPAYKNRIVAFHFAGHADQTELFFEGKDGRSVVADGKNLARYLGSKRNTLKLVFLNGCATKDLVGVLHDSGVPFVIAASRKISDSAATELAAAFYRQIRQQLSIGEAYDAAVDQLNTSGRLKDIAVNRGNISLEDSEEDAFPWGLYPKKDCDRYLAYLSVEPDIAQALRQGGQAYYDSLTGPDGRYRRIDISDLLFTPAELKQRKSERMDIRFEWKEDVILDKTAVGKLWEEEISHAVILGEGGMGKTVTLLHLWKQFRAGNGPIPAFVIANEFNQAKAENQEHWLKRYILQRYLKKPEPGEEDINQLWAWTCKEWKNKTPKLLLLLDGFNEITVDNVPLLRELTAWREQTRGVQIFLTSRYTSSMYWTTGFQQLKLRPLDETQIEKYLQENKVALPANEQLWKTLHNPMMLTIYASTSEIIEKNENPKMHFKESATSSGEILFNYLEAQLLKSGKAAGYDSESFAWYRWLLNHLLPWIGYQMQKSGWQTLKNTLFWSV